jgi:4-amino-4-deoxy-L-arabinose transferase-like glycosyltransferase
MSNKLRSGLRGLVAAVFVFLAFYNLGDYPTTWFDEGSHLHVPKLLVRSGEYSDYSSDGLRTFGPTLGVGPTVMLPVAGAFKIFGIGLLQARAVIALFLLGALYLFYRLARNLDGTAGAVLALLLLMSSRAIGVFETGRQVLGEVPALFLLLGGFLMWFSAWDGSRGRLTLAGVLLAAATITKYQILIALMPAIVVAGAANLLYYRAAPLRVFVWPAVLTGALFGLWLLILVLYLGPTHSLENLKVFREATAGAATVFSMPLMARSVRELVNIKTFGGCLIIALCYGVFVSLPRSRTSQQWGVLFLFVAFNLAWYVFASISWLRYAFAGLAISSLFVAKFFVDLAKRVSVAAAPAQDPGNAARLPAASLFAVVVAWPALIILPSLAATVLAIVRPPANAPSAMASYLKREVPPTAIIETWEPELGFLTDHQYHYPPTGMLNLAVRYIWSGGAPPRLKYEPLGTVQPPYVLVGAFARWVDLYSPDVLGRDYQRLVSIGSYELYRRKERLSVDPPLDAASH